MVTDSLPGLALGMEKAEGDIMRRRPRPTTDGIFSNGAGVDMVIANGANANVLYDIVDGKDVGTRFVGKNNK